jgi:amino acid adenylation domain-containing protein
MNPTPSQQEIWVASKAGGEDASRAFNECLTLTLRGALDAEALAAAFKGVLERHEVLRCAFSPEGDRLVAAPLAGISLARVDLSGGSADAPAARATRLDELLRREVETPFDLERPPLVRASLIRLQPDVHVFAFTAHYAVCDGWSAGVVARELGALYRARTGGAPAELAPAPSFAAYAAAAQAGGEAVAKAEAYWLERLAGELKPIELPMDRPRPARRTYASRRLEVPLAPALLAPLRRAGAPLLATFAGAVGAWLSRLTGQRDLVLGVSVPGQGAVSAGAGTDTLVGHCVHLLPMRAEIDPNASFSTHVAATGRRLAEAEGQQEVALGPLLRRLGLQFDPSRVPLVPVCVSLDVDAGPPDFGALAVARATVPRAFETFELYISAVDRGGHLVVEWSYNTALFDEATIARWMREVEALLADAAARPETPLKELSVLAPEECALLTRFNETRRPLAGVPVHEQVAARARQRPTHAAIRFRGRTFTYAEIDRRANQLARRLQREGVAPRACVGVYLNRSEMLPVALLAVLKCGASYVPMDPAYPPDRLAMMAEDAAVRVVVTQNDLLAGMPRVDKAICVDTLRAEIDAESGDPLDIAVRADDRAYVLFTSGSTGRPKGVEIPHGALENFLASMQRAPGFAAGDRLLAITTVSFDIAGLELHLPLVTGGTVVLAERSDALDPEILAGLLEREDISVMQATPATWRMIIDSGWQGRPGLRVLCGGEALPPGLATELLARVGELWNMYGPTETTIWSTVKRMAPGARITIGGPIDNTTVYVLDDGLARVPVGATGELWIGGEGVALGYIGRPELTRERFIASPFVPGERIYRTGDLGRVLPDGDLECLGRGDSQVKIRGFRIELGEIETAIERCGGLRKAVVLVANAAQDPQLVAYWVADVGVGAPVDLAALKLELGKALPAYMLPAHYVPLPSWPLTPAGKIDRKVLPSPDATSARPASVEALRDDVDVVIAELWQELLGVREVGLDDDFFALGGQSLRAVRLVAAVKAKFDVPFSLATLFAAPSLRQVANAIRGGGGQVERGAVALRREPGATRVFFICGVHLYRAAALALGAGIESYGVLVSADEKLEEALKSNVIPDLDVGELAREYVAAIRRVEPTGPYRLAGVSFGGVIAYEVARALEAAGERVDVLALLDPILPLAMRRSFVGGIRMIGSRVVKALRRPPPRQDAAASEGDASAARLSELREIAYDNATEAWSKLSPPYARDAILFRATDRSEFPGTVIDPDLGWRKLVRGRLEIHDLPGNHLGVLEAPNVERLAELLGRYVREAASASSTGAGPGVSDQRRAAP